MSIESSQVGAVVAWRRPALLVSIHDVSPLTAGSSRRGVDLAVAAGIPRSALTVLVIPRHENRAALDEDAETRDWVHSLVDAGACLAVHGLTHRMLGRARTPWEWVWAQGFARNQGELLLCDTADTEHRVEAALAIFRRAGLEASVRGFVPPAWLLSAEALAVIRRAGFGFYELLSGIVHRDALQARRLIGFGSLSWPEARVTAGIARWQLLRPPADTRFAIHPADLERASSMVAIRLILRRLLDHLVPMNYTDFLQHVA